MKNVESVNISNAAATLDVLREAYRKALVYGTENSDNLNRLYIAINELEAGIQHIEKANTIIAKI